MDGVGEGPRDEERRFVVRGRVQGVGYRWFVREAATRLGVRGWVKNEPDGAVVVEAAGTADRLDALSAVLRRGPRGAVVSGVDVSQRSSSDPLPDTFLITR